MSSPQKAIDDEFDRMMTDYRTQRARAQLLKRVHPAHFLLAMIELYEPCLRSDCESYCKTIDPMPQWVWKQIQLKAVYLIEHSGTMGTALPAKERDHLQNIADGKIPFDMKIRTDF